MSLLSLRKLAFSTGIGLSIVLSSTSNATALEGDGNCVPTQNTNTYQIYSAPYQDIDVEQVAWACEDGTIMTLKYHHIFTRTKVTEITNRVMASTKPGVECPPEVISEKTWNKVLKHEKVLVSDPLSVCPGLGGFCCIPLTTTTEDVFTGDSRDVSTVSYEEVLCPDGQVGIQKTVTTRHYLLYVPTTTLTWLEVCPDDNCPDTEVQILDPKWLPVGADVTVTNNCDAKDTYASALISEDYVEIESAWKLFMQKNELPLGPGALDITMAAQ